MRKIITKNVYNIDYSTTPDYWKVTSNSATVLSALVGVASAIDTSKKLSAITSQLSDVIALQIQILEEIRSLKVYFNKALYSAFLNDITKDLQAQSSRYEIIAASIVDLNVISEFDNNRLVHLLNDVEQTSMKLLTYGPAAYQAAGIGMILLKTLYNLLKVNILSQKLAYKKFNSKMADWLENEEYGINPLIKSAVKDKNNILNTFNEKMKETPQDSGGGSPAFWTYRLVGSIDTDIILQVKVMYEKKWKTVNGKEHKIYSQAVNLKKDFKSKGMDIERLTEIAKNLLTLKTTCKSWL